MSISSISSPELLASSRDKIAQVSVDGQVVQVPEGSTILDCLNAADVRVPSLCHDPRLKPAGACRLCLVRTEIDGLVRYVTACNTRASSGMAVFTDTAELRSFRQAMLRLLAANYPADAVETGPPNELGQWLQRLGVRAEGAGRGAADDSNPYIHVDMSQCILCYRCVRICDDVQGQFVWNIRNRGAETRIVVDSGLNLLQSQCVSCGACVDTCPTGALQDKSLLRHGTPATWIRTVCPYCGVGCELNAGTRDGRLVNVRPVMDSPVSRGHLCSKGRYAFEFVHAEDRILHPMVRRGETWQKVSWKEAIEAVAGVLKYTVARHGSDSVAILGSARATNEENYLTQKFSRVALQTNNVDCCARVCHSPTAAALKGIFGTGAATNSFDDIEAADTILLCGANATENHPIVGARIKQAAMHGTHLIVVDPRKIELCHYAEIHLQIRPGTNIPLLNAMACTIIEEGLVDRQFIVDRTEEYERFERFIREWSPESVATICGVDAKQIRKAARIYATAKPSMCIHGLGMTEHVQGTDAVACLANLPLLTGNIGKPGTGINPLRGQNNVQGAAQMGCDPDALTGSAPVETAAPLFRRIWKREIPTRKGLNLLEMMDAARDGRLKLLWAIGYDISLTNANASRTRAALKNLDALIVQDMFLNETAREFGTIFLPACSSFEKDGTFMNAERRIQRVRRALPPLSQSKPDWEIICAVAKSLGMEKEFQFPSSETIWDEIREVWPAARGITYKRLNEQGLQWPCPDEQHPGTAILHANDFSSRKHAPLSCISFSESPEKVSPEFPFLLVTGRSLQQFNAGTMTRRTEHKRLRQTDMLDISSSDANQLGILQGEPVKIGSHYGEVILPANITDAVAPGEVFATFQDPETFVNRVTSPFKDARTSAPEYKITAVNIAKFTNA